MHYSVLMQVVETLCDADQLVRFSERKIGVPTGQRIVPVAIDQPLSVPSHIPVYFRAPSTERPYKI